MANIISLSAQILNSTLTALDATSVFAIWPRTFDCKYQLYVGNNHEIFWQCESICLCKISFMWNESLIQINPLFAIKSKLQNIDLLQCGYQISQPSSETRFINDQYSYLYSSS
jgi:hypothetical protein